jgi:glycosyltransferase involved in cell wall biosynthesis
MCTVSVIIPAFNAAAFVGDAVRSALAQRNVDLEVLVVDDGSTDHTPLILEEFGKAVRTVRQANAGHVRARNKGASLARGEWLAFLDADDVWLPEKLEKQLALADAQTGLVYTDRMFFGDTSRVKTRLSDVFELHEGDIFEELLLHNFITVSSVLMRRSWFERLKGFDPDPFGSEDWDLWLRYSAEGAPVRVCREPLTRYRWSATSMTGRHKEMTRGRLLAIQRALQLPRGRQLSRPVVRRVLFNIWMDSAWYAAPALPGRAIAWYLKALSYSPLDPRPYKGLAKCCLRMN